MEKKLPSVRIRELEKEVASDPRKKEVDLVFTVLAVIKYLDEQETKKTTLSKLPTGTSSIPQFIKVAP